MGDARWQIHSAYLEITIVKHSPSILCLLALLLLIAVATRYAADPTSEQRQLVQHVRPEPADGMRFDATRGSGEAALRLTGSTRRTDDAKAGESLASPRSAEARNERNEPQAHSPSGNLPAPVPATAIRPSAEFLPARLRADDPPQPGTPDTPKLASEVSPWPQAADTSSFGEERREIEAALATQKSDSRDDLLAMYGRSSAASGRFNLGAAAYGMFLDEFGTEHVYSQQIAMRLADCLAPLDLDSIDVAHTPAGPQFHPQWRMGYSPRPEHLRQAVDAYELATELASDDYDRGQGLLRLGWVHRALDNWAASTEAWDRCAESSPDSRVAVQAGWLAAENLAWTEQPKVAAERWRRLASRCPDETCSRAALDRAESLEAESRRTTGWLTDPVTSLIAEIERRAGHQAPSEVYASVVHWLERQGQESALNDIRRWVSAQDDWPALWRIEAHNALVSDMFSQSADNEATRREAADRLRQVIELAPTDDWAVPAAIRLSHLLKEMDEYEQADHTLADIQARTEGAGKWTPLILSERIGLLLDRGDRAGARVLFETLASSYPGSDYTAAFTSAFVDQD